MPFHGNLSHCFERRENTFPFFPFFSPFHYFLFRLFPSLLFSPFLSLRRRVRHYTVGSVGDTCGEGEIQRQEGAIREPHRTKKSRMFALAEMKIKGMLANHELRNKIGPSNGTISTKEGHCSSRRICENILFYFWRRCPLEHPWSPRAEGMSCRVASRIAGGAIRV